MTVIRELPFDFVTHSIKETRRYDNLSFTDTKSLRAAHKKILDMIGTDISKLPLPKLRALESIVSDEIIAWYDGYEDSLKKVGIEVAKREVEWNTVLLEEYATAPVVATSYIAVALSGLEKRMVGGKTFVKLYEDIKIGHADKVVAMMSAAWAQGLGSDEASLMILGAIKGGEHSARTIARSFMAHMSAEARDMVISNNDDIIDSKKWISVLDSRTTWEICGVRDQKRYTLKNEPIGHNLPYESGPGRIHWNCRSIIVPVIKSNIVRLERTSVDPGESYERGDNVTQTGKVRKPTKPNRDSGKFKIGRVSSTTDYETWLRSAGNENIGFLEDVVGSRARAERFMSGESLKDISAHKTTK